MNPVRDDLLALSDFAWGRLRQRLDGLTDAEYHWEPVPHCRAVRRLDDGTYRSDGPVRSGRGRRSTVAREDTARFTTVAWRLCHLIDTVGAERIGPWLGQPAIGADADRDPGTVAEALPPAEHACQRWRDTLAATTDASLAEPIGPVGAMFAGDSRRAFALHILDELIHHAAEIGVLHDLYAAGAAG